MSYKEKKEIVAIVTGILLFAAYCIIVYSRIQARTFNPDDLRSWAAAILIFIGIGVAASVVIQIIFHILLSIALSVRKQIQDGKRDDKEIEKALELEMVEDEMDKLISLKSLRVGLTVAGIGFIAGLASLLLNYSPAVMLNIVFGSFSLGSVLMSFTQLYFYRSGVKNGR
jgi:hypothetical protein